MKKRYGGLAALVAAGLLLLGPAAWAAGSHEAAKGPIVVASKIDTEGGVIGEMIVLMLRDHGFKVVDKTEFGPTDVIRKAIMSGEIDIYPEYTGNGAFFFQGVDPDIWKDPAKGYAEVKQLDFQKNGIVWLSPAPANNTWAIAVRKDLADAKGLKSLDDLAGYLSGGGAFKLAASEEFVSRPDVLPAFEQAYGFSLTSDQLLVVSGGNTAQTEKAAADGTNGVNAAMAYGTDGALAALGLVVLADSKEVEPVYEPAPIVRGAVYAEYPEIAGILAPVFASLSLQTLQGLNAKVAIGGAEASAVAEAYLKANGFLGAK